MSSETRPEGASFALHDDPTSIPVLDAATIMLIRDGVDGLEVAMLQRNLASDFVGGAYVFPGGGVDDDDSSPESLALCRGRDDAEASAAVGVAQGGLGFWVAAVRESFEESGLLLAEHADGSPISFSADVAERFAVHRRDVDRGARTLASVCAEENLRLAVDNVQYFSRWVTPLGAPRRYDTRFFLAAAPPGQEPLADDREVIASRWVTPREALADHHAGRMTMIFPTVRTMVALERFDDTAHALAHTRSQQHVAALVPMLIDEGGGLRLRLPGDPEGNGGDYDPMSGTAIGVN